MIKHYMHLAALARTQPALVSQCEVVQALQQERQQLQASLVLLNGFKSMQKHFSAQIKQVDSLLSAYETRSNLLH